MTSQTTTLKLASVGFAVLWTLGMILQSGDYSVVSIVITTVAGVVAGFFWYLFIKGFQALWLKWSR